MAAPALLLLFHSLPSFLLSLPLCAASSSSSPFFPPPIRFNFESSHFSPQLSFQFLRCSKKTTYLEISSPPIIENEISTRDRAPISRAEERSTPPLGEIYREKGKREPPTAERFQPDSRMKVDEPFHALRAPISRSRVNTNY